MQHYQRRFSQDVAPQYVDVGAGRPEMIQYLNVFYDIYPYLCGTVFLIGSWLRYDYGQYTWRAASSQMLDKRGVVLWSNLFHIGILGIFFGHLFGMLTPTGFTPGSADVAKQLMAMILGGICGVLTLVGGAGLLIRRLTNPRIRATSSTADILILSISADSVRAGSGRRSPSPLNILTAAKCSKLVDWAQAVVTFHGGASAHLDMARSIYRVHLVLGMTIFLGSSVHS